MPALALQTERLSLDEAMRLVISRYRDNGWGFQEVVLVLEDLIEEYVPLANEEARQEQEAALNQ